MAEMTIIEALEKLALITRNGLDVKVSLLFLTWPVYFPQLLRFKIPHLKI